MAFFANSKYNSNNDDTLLEDFDVDAYLETCAYMDLAALPQAELKSIIESEEAEILEEKGMIGRKTFIRLNKKDDLERRTSAAAYQLAKDANDPHWHKLVKYLGLKNQEKEYILKKYGNKGSRIAKQTQKDYLKHPVAKLLQKKDLTETREKIDDKK